MFLGSYAVYRQIVAEITFSARQREIPSRPDLLLISHIHIKEPAQRMVLFQGQCDSFHLIRTFLEKDEIYQPFSITQPFFMDGSESSSDFLKKDLHGKVRLLMTLVHSREIRSQ